MSKAKIIKLLNKVFDNWGGEDYFDWKYNNPFGSEIFKSEVINGELVSVRLFMPWRMYSNNSVFFCYQATDSATDERFRGKGLFKKLTIEVLKELKGNEFVFNFPNKNSLHSYLKLGWNIECQKKAKYFPVYNFIKSTCLDDDIDSDKVISTCWDEETLKWRLANDNEYKIFKHGKGSLVYREIKVKGLLVADVLKTETTFSCKDLKGFMQHLIKDRVFIVRYIGHNTSFDRLIENNLLLTFSIGRLVNMVSHKIPAGYKLRLEMLDADYI